MRILILILLLALSNYSIGLCQDQPIQVALTFDDGPSSYTPQVLSLLKDYNAKATFFVVGDQLENYPSFAKQEAEEGHNVANHLMTHPSAAETSSQRLIDEFNENNQLIEEITGQHPKFFRPPYGEQSETYTDLCEDNNMNFILWDIDPRDWARPPAEEIADSIIENLRPGAIILLHDGGGNRENTVAALQIVLAELKSRGWQSVTLSTIMKK